ncbi:MAG: inositol phosphorylceramide synthase, partial [Myxococcales bacterium]
MELARAESGKLRVPEPWRFVALGIAIVLTAAMIATGKWHVEDYVVLPFYAALPWFGPGARRLSFSITPFLVAGILYDLYGLLMPYRGAVHVSDLYLTDLTLFGAPFAGTKMILPDWLALHAHPAIDAVTGAAYILYLAEVFILAIYLHFRDPPRTLVLGLGFFVMNVAGMILWFCWPAAPPWYVSLHGLGPADMSALPSPAGTARFDTLIGYPLFHGFYARSVNVFGAMPSLHCAYPTLTFLVVRSRSRSLFAFTLGFALLVVFSAMYLQHHYVLDVLAGLTTGTVCYFTARALAKVVTARLAEPRAGAPSAAFTVDGSQA